MNEQMKEQLNNIVGTLEQAIYANETAIDDPEKGYPYAAGYSRSALKQVLTNINDLLKNANNN